MTESLKGKCNKCDKEYTAAPIGVVHKCGCCEGGRVVVEGRDSIFLNVPVGNILSPPSSFSFKDSHVKTPTEEEIRRQVEKEICDYFRVKTDLPWCGLDPHTASCISDLIEKRKYLPPKTSD